MNGLITKYVHYGSNKFDINKFHKIVNQQFFSKPLGGLWACRSNAKFGWKDWCISENFETKRLKENFEFILDPNAKILVIKNEEDILNLPKQNSDLKYGFLKDSCLASFLDFEELSKEYDAIEVYLDNFNLNFSMFYTFMGWDVDSLLVMNPDIIKGVIK